MRVAAAGQDARRALFGALDYASGRLCWQVRDAKSGDAFAAFLAQVARTWPDETLVLVLDNVSYHRSPPVRAWWAAQEGRVVPFWLPAYTPTLNLLERVWRFLKHKLACHRFWADADGLAAAADDLLARIEARFHADPPPSIRLVNYVCATA
jgi:transposase